SYLNNLASLHARAGDWAEAAALHSRAKPIMIGRHNGVASDRDSLINAIDRGNGVEATDRTGLIKTMLMQNAGPFRHYARALYYANPQSTHALAEGFELAQWALQTDAGEALAQMSTRFAKGEGPLVDLVREQQNLVARRRSEDKRLLAAVGRADASTVAALN